VIGLGLPLVAVGLLGLVMPPAEAAAILIVPSLVTNVWQGLAGGALREVTGRLWPMLIGICIGTGLSATLLPGGKAEQATFWLGVVLVVYAVFGLCNLHPKTPRRHESWIGFLAGLGTGLVAIVTAVFTVPGVPYVQSLGFDRDKMVQALGLSFTVSAVTLAIALSRSGEMNASVALPALAALLASLLGMLTGQKVRSLASPKAFRLCFFIGLLALGAHLALHSLL
jgi:uncharacterized membrane protein YfcA